MTSPMDYYLIHAMDKGLGGASSPLLTHASPDASGFDHEASINQESHLTPVVMVVGKKRGGDKGRWDTPDTMKHACVYEGDVINLSFFSWINVDYMMISTINQNNAYLIAHKCPHIIAYKNFTKNYIKVKHNRGKAKFTKIKC